MTTPSPENRLPKSWTPIIKSWTPILAKLFSGRHVPYLVVISLYLVCALLVDPRGEFPLNDDWSYTRSAFIMGTQNRMAVDEFSAPNLVGQALYGGFLVRIFGRSFLVLRLSTLLLSCGLTCLLWHLLLKMGVQSFAAWVATLSWLFNPVQFCLSFSFMTEIPFLFTLGAATVALLDYLEYGKTRPLLVCGAIIGYGYLIRQTAALFIAAIAICLIVDHGEKGAERRMARLVIWAVPPGIFVCGFTLWARLHGGATPAARRKLELLRYLSGEQIVGNLLGQLFYLSLFLLPLVAYLLPNLKRLTAGLNSKVGVPALAGWIIIPSAGLWWFHSRYSRGPYLPARTFHGQMPFLLNILYDSGLGPVTLDPTYYGPPATPVYPRIWWGVTLIVAAGAAALGLLLTLAGRDRRPVSHWFGRRAMLFFAGISLSIVTLFEVIFSHQQEGGLFDRHILSAALPLLMLLGLLSRGRGVVEADGKQPNLHSLASSKTILFGSTSAAALLLVAFAWFSITATHDYLAWNRLRWELGTELLAQGVDPLLLSGGFEFNGWNNYDTFRARGHIEKVYYWWYDRPDYLIAMQQQENYHSVRKLEYYSWLHRRNLPIYLLRRD